MISSSRVRQGFLDFFKQKAHKIVPSASVIPFEDPTLLFTNAGMNQFKDVFLGTGHRDYKRCADTQKCIRVSGKHNDLEEVGHDGYHHTFFEMLGNWSFGDYYKKEAIEWAWELLTGVWGLDSNRLWATVYREDDEALELWKTVTDIDHSHILKFDEKDNFWEMGETGPCGPCSEIHYDFTPNGCKPTDVNADNPDVMEIWNLVFIQYNRDTQGVLHDLPARHVDTGMGFERMVRVLQNKSSNYETDVFQPLIDELIQLSGKEYSGDKHTSAMNVIADHVRTLTFAMADGAIPSNEGRGYVLRRILRRAARYGRNIGMQKPFIYNLVDVLVKTMGTVFPEIVEKKDFIKEVIKGEEESFNETLDRGLVIFNAEIDIMKFGKYKENAEERLMSIKPSGKSPIFSGKAAFSLHDTYGFPIDLTQLMAKEHGYEVDLDEFEQLMNVQKSKSRHDRMDKGLEDVIKNPPNEQLSKIADECIYDPYDIGDGFVNTEIKLVRALNTFMNDQMVQIKMIILKRNPFYTESGGQVTDTGRILISETNQELVVYKSEDKYVIVYPFEFEIPQNANVIAKVDFPRRQAIQRNHSATHLVHEALRRVLGSHIKQMGSYLDDKLLRFDFPHFHKLKDDEIKNIEEMVNDRVKDNISVQTRLMKKDEAGKEYPNLRMFFGEKYGDEVRVVIIDDKYSVELCGGTHVRTTSDIGLFKIVKEESISSGTRRIFARTGEGIVSLINEKIEDIESILAGLPEKYSNNFKAGISELKKDFEGADFHNADMLNKLIAYHDSTISSLHELREKYLEEKKHAEKELAKNTVQQAIDSLDSVIAGASETSGIKLVSSQFNVNSADELKEIGDALRNKLKSGVGLLYAVIDEKVSLCAVVTDDLIKEKKLSAGKIAGDAAKILGGGGGGKPHLATAGGKDVSKIDEALKAFPEIVKRYTEKN